MIIIVGYNRKRMQLLATTRHKLNPQGCTNTKHTRIKQLQKHESILRIGKEEKNFRS